MWIDGLRRFLSGLCQPLRAQVRRRAASRWRPLLELREERVVPAGTVFTVVTNTTTNDIQIDPGAGEHPGHGGSPGALISQITSNNSKEPNKLPIECPKRLDRFLPGSAYPVGRSVRVS